MLSHNFNFLIDSGASVNILDEKDYLQLKPKPLLEKSTVKIFPYDTNTPIPVVGHFKAELQYSGKAVEAILYVVQKLLSFACYPRL